MVWTIKYSDIALKQLKKLDISTAKRVIRYMDEKISPLKDPRTHGKALSFDKKGYWRYRVGDYRIICQINNDDVIILVLEVGHRKEIYS